MEDDEEKGDMSDDILGDGLKMSHRKLKTMTLNQPLTFQKSMASIKHTPLREFAKGMGVKVIGLGRESVLKAIRGWHERVLLKQEQKRDRGGGVPAPAVRLMKKQKPTRATMVALDEGEERAGMTATRLRINCVRCCVR